MPDMTFRAGSLVLYKNRPAQVKRVADKLEIETDQGTTLNVRPKDISLLHPGPLSSLDELRPPVGEVKIAWELLAGETTSLPELAELAYDAYTPATAWAAWQLVADGLYFRGTPETISAATPEEVAAGQLARESKAAEAQAWAGFLERARQGRFESADSRFLREVEEAALGLHPKSRVLQALGSSQTPENAHAWLLKLGYWDQTVNPYPRRLGVTTTQPEVDLPDVPDEARVDLTHLPAFAIDDEGSRDPDDALSLVERRLWVHVADVAALAPPDSPADEQARARGANLYMPEMTVTMLPAKATQLLGLGLSEVSPALSFGLDLDAEGNVTEMEVVPSWVRVQRLTYEAVETRLAEEPFHSMLRLARHHHARRTANGAILIDLPEIKIRVQDDEVVLRPLPALKSRDLVREAMLMAGEAVGHFALEHDIPFPFTTQEPPETDEDFPDTIAGMVARRRTMQRSQMKSTPAPHAGLGMDVYAQATSPLRRYLDLVVHQQLRAYLRGTGLLDPQQVLERVGAAESITGSIRQAERLAQKHWTLVYLLQHPGWHGEGVLVDKRGSRSRVLIPELDLEVQVHVRDDLPLDSRLSLRLTGVDLAELEAHFRAEG
jgi:exoribonuclease-2